jgi:ubiquinone/menaquinone biosynthesis C-methylase UbiE
MIEGAKRRLAATTSDTTIDFREASVLDLPFDAAGFDVVTSHRCLMALLDWELQKQALVEIHRTLRPGASSC